jgi:Stringent starvation protein B
MESKPEEITAEKRRAFEAALKVGVVTVHLDARAPGVLVPPLVAQNPALVLAFSSGQPALSGLQLNEQGIVQTLQFAAAHERCEVPWSAVWAIVAATGERLTFTDSMPPEVARGLAMQALQLRPLVHEAIAGLKAMQQGAHAPPGFWVGWGRRAHLALTGQEASLIQDT